MSPENANRSRPAPGEMLTLFKAKVIGAVRKLLIEEKGPYQPAAQLDQTNPVDEQRQNEVGGSDGRK